MSNIKRAKDLFSRLLFFSLARALYAMSMVCHYWSTDFHSGQCCNTRSKALLHDHQYHHHRKLSHHCQSIPNLPSQDAICCSLVVPLAMLPLAMSNVPGFSNLSFSSLVPPSSAGSLPPTAVQCYVPGYSNQWILVQYILVMG